MTCPSCGSNDTRIYRTVDSGMTELRERRCLACPAFWTSTDRVNKGSIRTVKRQGLMPLADISVGGALNGHVSSSRSSSDLLSSDLLSSGSLSLPIGSQGVDRTRVSAEKPKRGRGDAIEYPAEFELIWASCKGKKGNKDPAFKAWSKFKPDSNLTIERWALWMSTDQWQRGYSLHMSTWLNAKGWQDVPDPSEFRGKASSPNAVDRKTEDYRAQFEQGREWAAGGKK